MRPTVNLICAHLVNQQTGEALQGGAERYTVELIRLLAGNGRRVRVLHKAVRAFESNLYGCEVRGVAAPRGAFGNAFFSRRVSAYCGPGDVQIYVLAELAFPRMVQPAVGVQHGIWWEGDYPLGKRLVNRVIQSKLAHGFRAYVCVDTAFINWLYAEIPGRNSYAHRLRYIPNFSYLAGEEGDAERDESEIRILFPRRMEYFRGAMWFFEAMRDLWSKGRRYKAVFCGPGSLQDDVRRAVEESGYSHLAEFKVVELDEMRGEYLRASVVVIPTIAREGTSLACIEAMAMGCPVVSSHVGGLGNLVIPGVNALMVDLRKDSLAAAIETAVERPEVRRRLIERGRETARGLCLENWRARWLEVLDGLGSEMRGRSLFPRGGMTTKYDVRAK